MEVWRMIYSIHYQSITRDWKNGYQAVEYDYDKSETILTYFAERPPSDRKTVVELFFQLRCVVGLHVTYSAELWLTKQEVYFVSVSEFCCFIRASGILKILLLIEQRRQTQLQTTFQCNDNRFDIHKNRLK